MTGSENPDCVRARAAMAAFVDGELAAAESDWMPGHLDACGACRRAVEGFAAVDGALTAWGVAMERRNPAPAGARAELASQMAAGRAQRWMPLAAAAAAAAVLLAAGLLMKLADSAGDRGVGAREAKFVEIPYVAPPDPRENTQVVRMNLTVATLLRLGYRVAADPNAEVPADVLVGEDGRAHAVRVLADIEMTGD